jgi:hypothetical protein
MDLETLKKMRRKRDFWSDPPHECVKRLWPTAASFDHFTKNHASKLVAAGAICKLAGTWFINEEKFFDGAMLVLSGEPSTSTAVAICEGAES